MKNGSLALMVLFVLLFPAALVFAAEDDRGVGSESVHSPDTDFFDLGVRDDYMKRERYRTREQINTFIPPLYQPAFVGHGYVLPPGALRVGINSVRLAVDSTDFFRGSVTDVMHENHNVDRVRLNIDALYGLDKNLTLFLNVPLWSSRSSGSVHPAGVTAMNLFVEGNSQQLGDITLMAKKKWMDQGNFPFNLATVLGVQFPTGSNEEKFDSPMTVQMPDGSLGVAFGGGQFQRFSDDGRLPLSLQPGTGGFGFNVGVMGTRQFNRVASALHLGTLYKNLGGADGAEPGDELRFFASFVKPILREQLSIDLAVNGMRKGDDRYDGTFTHPIPDAGGNLAGMATTPRPAFQGGTIVFFSPSIIWTPQPQYRVFASYSYRLNDPELGPWPGSVVRIGTTFTY